MSDNAMLIALAEARTHVVADASLEERLASAMRATYRHWACASEDEQFKAAVGAVISTASEDERERLDAELKMLAMLSAATSGIPVDWSAVGEDRPEPVGLLKLWDATKGAA